MNWISVTSQNSYDESQTSKLRVLGSGAFEKLLGQEGGALINGASPFIKCHGRACFPTLCYVKKQ
jgi:hypothetical protein